MTVTLSQILVTLLIVGTLLTLNALFVATEFSLVKLRFSRFEGDTLERARAHPLIAAMLSDMGATLKVVRLGVTACTIGLGFVLVPLILAVLRATQVAWGAWEIRVALLVSFTIAVMLHFVLGELVPRAIALQFPVRTLMVASWPVRITRWLTAPLLGFLGVGSKLLLRIFNLNSRLDFNLIDVEAQIRSQVSDGEEMPPLAEKMLHNVIDLRKRVAQDILLPRNQIRFFDLEDDVEANMEMARRTGHTRFPLCEGDLDRCIGVVHIKDLFRGALAHDKIDFRKIQRKILRFPSNEPLESVLESLLRLKSHFALVTDEFDGTVGAITLEDILEELVGEIQDEFDREETLIRSLRDGRFAVDGLAPLHDVSDEIGVPIDVEDVSTFGGLITSELGKIPATGETVLLGRLEIKVLRVDEKRVLETEVKLLPPDEDGDGDTASESAFQS